MLSLTVIVTDDVTLLYDVILVIITQHAYYRLIGYNCFYHIIISAELIYDLHINLAYTCTLAQGAS